MFVFTGETPVPQGLWYPGETPVLQRISRVGVAGLARKRSKNGNGTEDRGLGETGTQSLRSILALASLALLIGVGALGLVRVKKHVYAQPEYQRDYRLEMVNPPEWVVSEEWQDRILASIQIPEGLEWLDESLVPRLAEKVQRSGWVSKIDRIEQGMDGVIRISAQYRRPIAMIRTRHEGEDCFVPVDKTGVRLPEMYRSVSDHLGWMRILGVDATLPEVGQPFKGEDAVAGVRLANLLFEQDFSYRISGIDVANFRGRHSKRDDHIKLKTRDGSTIVWGSAIGEEIEEPTAKDKLRMIALQFKKGSPQAEANVSVFSNAWIQPLPPDDPNIRTVSNTPKRHSP